MSSNRTKMNKRQQSNLITILSDEEQTPAGLIVENTVLKGIGFCFWPIQGRYVLEIRELINWCAENLSELHSSIRVETGINNTCMTIYCRFEDIDYDRMEFQEDLLSNQKARIRTKAILDEARVHLILLMEGMYKEPMASQP